MCTEHRAEQYENAYSPIEVTESGMSMEVNARHEEKAHCSILVTEAGMSMLVSF